MGTLVVLIQHFLPRRGDAMRATVRDAMSTELVHVQRQSSIVDAECLLLQHGLDELFVTDAEGRLLGVVPDYALLKHRLAAPLENFQTIECLMSRRFLVIDVDSPLSVAARYLREHVHRRLAVVEDMRLVGQVTRRTVLRLLAIEADSAPPLVCVHGPRPKMLSPLHHQQLQPLTWDPRRQHST